MKLQSRSPEWTRYLRLDLHYIACSNEGRSTKRLQAQTGLAGWRRAAGSARSIEAEGSMAQLSDDCFAFGGPMRSLDDTAA
ncbi:MAG: hypothetical protein E5Y81_22145, partial [Mesorhizobium sp.]